MDYGRGYIIPFAKIDQAFLDTKGVFDIYEKMTFTILSRFLNESNGDIVFPSIELLAELVGASKPTIIKALKGLEEKGLIRVEKVQGKGINKKNIYHLKPYGKPLQKKKKESAPKDDIPYAEIIDHLNQKVGSRFKPGTSATKKTINGRWEEGHRLEDFIYVIDVKTEEWIGTTFEKHLNPETLFRPSNFEKYLNQKRKSAGNEPTFSKPKTSGQAMTEEERLALLSSVDI